MKKLLLSLALLFVFGVSSAYAKDGHENSFSSKSEGHHNSGGDHGFKGGDDGHHGGNTGHGGDGGTGNVPAVPEPEEWAMMIVGLGLIGMRLLRKNDNEESTTLIG